MKNKLFQIVLLLTVLCGSTELSAHGPGRSPPESMATKEEARRGQSARMCQEQREMSAVRYLMMMWIAAQWETEYYGSKADLKGISIMI